MQPVIPQKTFSVLIADGGKNFSPPVINCLAQAPGIKIDILSEKHWAISRFSRHVRNFHVHNTEPYTRAWVEIIKQITEDTGVDIVLPVDQPAIRAISQYRDLLRKPVHSTPVPELPYFDIAANKWNLAQHIQQHNLPMPATIPCQGMEQLEQNLPSLTFPVLTKPVEGKGGHGIQKWHDPKALKDHLKGLKEADTIIIQSFIYGHFAGCSVLCKEGRILASTIQKGLLPPRSQFSHPEDILMIHDEKIVEIIEQLMASLHWSGVANIDLCFDEQEGQYKILEVNPRFWGTMLGSLNAGVNFPYLACLAGLGIEFPKPTYKTTPYLGGVGAIRLLTRHDLPQTNIPLRIKDSTIKYFLSDPLPRLARWAEKFIKYIFKIKE